MKLFFSLWLVSICGQARAAEPVEARWREYVYDGPNYRRNDCGPALMALENVLEGVGARNLRKSCSWNYGLTARWEALEPVKPDPAAARIGALIERAGPAAGLPGAGGAWRDLAPPAVRALWAAFTLSWSTSDVRSCNIHSDVQDYLFGALAVRNVNVAVFCQPGSSYIQARLEHLAPVD